MFNLKKWCERYPALALVGNTPLLKLNLFEQELPDVEIYAKCEYTNPGGSLKDRPVRHMLLAALEEGTIEPGKTIIDSSSGNAGIALAAIGAMIGFPVELVLPGNASIERKKRIIAHGAKVIETPAEQGYDAAIKEARRTFEADRQKYFMPDQYRNPQNPRAHFETTAVEILAQVPRTITHFVAGCGTGGTITGCGRRLKEHDATITVAMIDIEEFPGIEGLKPLKAGNIVPDIFDERVVDERIPVTAEAAAAMCRRLANAGLFFGLSTGGYLCGAYQLANRIKKGCIVTILNDIGERYFSTNLWG